MDYKKDCPYCQEHVRKVMILQDGMKRYRFYCKCYDDKECFDHDEHVAYKVYLEARENANLTNFDIYLGHDGRTKAEVEKVINSWCHDHIEVDCFDCLFGKLGRCVTDFDEPEFATCIDFLDWLDRKV